MRLEEPAEAREAELRPHPDRRVVGEAVAQRLPHLGLLLRTDALEPADISRIIATAGRAEPSLTKLIRRTVELM